MTALLQSITVRRTIKADRARVFAAFAHADVLAKWFSPSPDIAVEVLAFSFVRQGRYRLRYTMPDGYRPVVGGVYETIEEPAQIVFSWVWEEPDPHAGMDTRVTVQFVEKDGNTEVVVTHDALPDEAACARHVQGWNATLDRLQTQFNNSVAGRVE